MNTRILKISCHERSNIQRRTCSAANYDRSWFENRNGDLGLLCFHVKNSRAIWMKVDLGISFLSPDASTYIIWTYSTTVLFSAIRMDLRRVQRRSTWTRKHSCPSSTGDRVTSGGGRSELKDINTGSLSIAQATNTLSRGSVLNTWIGQFTEWTPKGSFVREQLTFWGAWLPFPKIKKLKSRKEWFYMVI